MTKEQALAEIEALMNTGTSPEPKVEPEPEVKPEPTVRISITSDETGPVVKIS
jgi:hypothetical protein